MFNPTFPQSDWYVCWLNVSLIVWQLIIASSSTNIFVHPFTLIDPNAEKRCQKCSSGVFMFYFRKNQTEKNLYIFDIFFRKIVLEYFINITIHDFDIWKFGKKKQNTIVILMDRNYFNCMRIYSICNLLIW